MENKDTFKFGLNYIITKSNNNTITGERIVINKVVNLFDDKLSYVVSFPTREVEKPYKAGDEFFNHNINCFSKKDVDTFLDGIEFEIDYELVNEIIAKKQTELNLLKEKYGLSENYNKLYDIQYLKDNCERIYYFGLGFIQVVLNKYERVHFYSDELANLATSEGWHNHRYNFKSKVLKGRFSQSKVKIVSGDTHTLKNVSCSKDNHLINNPDIKVGIEDIKLSNGYLSEDFFAGDEYEIFFNEFHYVGTAGNTITHLTRTDYITDVAQVLIENGKEIVCPFSVEFSEKELWVKVKEIIDND